MTDPERHEVLTVAVPSSVAGAEEAFEEVARRVGGSPRCVFDGTGRTPSATDFYFYCVSADEAFAEMQGLLQDVDLPEGASATLQYDTGRTMTVDISAVRFGAVVDTFVPDRPLPRKRNYRIGDWVLIPVELPPV